MGNTLGHEGRAALSGFLVASGLHGLTAWSYGRLGLHPAASEGEIRILHTAFGPLVATVLPLCARVVYTVGATTGILAIAGYVFNEVSLTLVGLLLQASVAQSAVAKMTKEELRAKLDSPDVVIVDVRLGKDWKASEEKIKGAVCYALKGGWHEWHRAQFPIETK